jgi:hypothetical protein
MSKIVVTQTCKECLKNNPWTICQVVFCPCERIEKEEPKTLIKKEER